MIVVIFEVETKASEQAQYLALAAQLKEHLAHIDGFISIERFQSLAQPGKLLSLSFWRDEEAVKAWRNMEQHRAAQAQGRAEIFENYRIRVASVLRDYGMQERQQVPHDSQQAHGGVHHQQGH
ncbi:MAG: antibiotic biosynthesis monooxygenase [Burkholderiaceae bacterium]|nr:MAG: antibiotic biosynthesis monooxygenase [Burkholderiaceae bacterium]